MQSDWDVRWRTVFVGLLLAMSTLFFAPVAVGSAAVSSGATPAGSLDTSFGSGGVVTVPVGSSGGAAALVVQPDGKIVTAGQATINGAEVIFATRMTPTGSLDPTFGHGGIVTVSVNGGSGVDSSAGLALQPDGKIVIAGAGHASRYAPMGFAVVRLNPNGSLDTSFGNGGTVGVTIGAQAIANAVVVQPDGKIVLAGTALETKPEFAAMRLNANGSLDTSFGTGGIVKISGSGGAVWSMVRQADGKLVMVGQAPYASRAVANAQQFVAVRLQSNGSLDPGFGRGGIVMLPIGVTSLGFGVASQSDGKLVLAGIAWTTTEMNATARLRSDGTLDPTYGTGGIATVHDWNGANGLVLDSAGRAVLPTTGPGAVRINAGGTADTTFGTGGIATIQTAGGGGMNGAAITPDGNLVLAGALKVNGRTEVGVIRLKAGSSTTTVTTTVTGALASLF